MNVKKLRRLLVDRPVEQVVDIMKLNGWSLVDANEQRLIFSDGFDSIEVYVRDKIARRVF